LLEEDCDKSFVATISYFIGKLIESCRKILTAVVGERALERVVWRGWSKCS